jgi:hypothetical protein
MYSSRTITIGFDVVQVRYFSGPDACEVVILVKCCFSTVKNNGEKILCSRREVVISRGF